MITLLAMSLALADAAVPTGRASDAVQVFDQLCVQMFAGNASGIDESRFSVTLLSPDTVAKIKPDLAGSKIWDVHGEETDVSLLVHYTDGMCVVEVAEADEQDMRTAYGALVEQTASALDASIEREEDRINRIDGKDATTSMWRIATAEEDVLLVLTTYPDSKFMIQHLMTASYVR